MRRNGLVGCSLMFGVSLVFALVPVRAGSVPLSDSIAAYDSTGTLLPGGGPFEAPETGECAPNCTYVLNTLGDPTKVGRATVLTDPDGSISDVFGVVDFSSSPLYNCNPAVAGSCVFLSFSSDPSPDISRFGDGTNFTTLAEGNGVFDATAYLAASLRANGDTAQFISDVETTVPEPGTLVLFGAGLLGLGAMRRRR